MAKLKRGELFSSIPAPKVGRTAFDMSFEHKTTTPMGKLIPLYIQECLPGDSWTIKPSGLIRLQSLISPMMQRVDASMLFFKEPYRHIWDGFEDFITGGSDGKQSPMPPYFTIGQLVDCLGDSDLEFNFQTGSLLDYLGIPLPYTNDGTSWSVMNFSDIPDDVRNLKLSALPLRAYAHIYNEYFRDQNVDSPIEYETTSGQITNAELLLICQLRNRCWKKDYFTSALPTPQRGPDVSINLASSADLKVKEGYSSGLRILNPELITQDGTKWDLYNSPQSYASLKNSTAYPSSTIVSEIDGSDNIASRYEVDLSSASSVTIVALRTAFKLQQFLERNNVAGGRYIESVLAHFGVKSSDARLQRPEFLGGGSQPIVISEVETNADSQGDFNNVVGDLAGKAKSFGGFGEIKSFCEEHCFIIGLFSVMPTASYSQGINRMWTRFDKFDYFWPEMQFVGEQAIKQNELYVDYKYGQDIAKDFGYTPRYAEYKYNSDRISGDFRTTLSFWHMGRLFNENPQLNSSFLECNPTDRVFAVQDTATSQRCIVDMWFDIVAVRKMAKFGLPKMS